MRSRSSHTSWTHQRHMTRSTLLLIAACAMGPTATSVMTRSPPAFRRHRLPIHGHGSFLSLLCLHALRPFFDLQTPPPEAEAVDQSLTTRANDAGLFCRTRPRTQPRVLGCHVGIAPLSLCPPHWCLLPRRGPDQAEDRRCQGPRRQVGACSHTSRRPLFSRRFPGGQDVNERVWAWHPLSDCTASSSPLPLLSPSSSKS